MVDKQSLEFATVMSNDTAAIYLEALAKGLRDGSISIGSLDEVIALEVGDEVNLDLEAKSAGDKGKSSIEISLSWRARRRLPAAPPSLVIRSGTQNTAVESGQELVVPSDATVAD